MPDVIAIADAVAAELNTGSFSIPFTARRMLLPDFALAELTDIKVTIVPNSVEMTPFCRQWTQYDYAIDIGIQKKLSGDTDTDLPELLALVDEMLTFLRKRTLTAAPSAVWIKTLNEPLYSREHLSQSRVFTSVITVTYRTVG